MFPHLYRAYINARGEGNLIELVIDLGFGITTIQRMRLAAAQGAAPGKVAGRIVERHLDGDYPQGGK